MDPSRRLSFFRSICCLLFIALLGRLNCFVSWLGSAWNAQDTVSRVVNGKFASSPQHQHTGNSGRVSQPQVMLAAKSRGDVSTVGSQDLNLYGQELKPCSQEGDTTTGWTRTGFCAWEPSDRGYHQVCVTMSRQFLQASAKYDANDLSSVVDDGGHWCICAWAWAAAVSRDPEKFENLKLDCTRTNAYLRDVYQSYASSGRGMVSPSGVQYEAQAALEAVEKLCKA
ncbi:unnamed protein product [Symbiodinium pilosum]|uniref:Uncharacterized protein n=1 Tax=Symbiodinium pilosum TaxID=2952 RepID=A0A812SP07_SYMPI|nr:unnamed protein product [Symbiodinium pilosum]